MARETQPQHAPVREGSPRRLEPIQKDIDQARERKANPDLKTIKVTPLNIPGTGALFDITAVDDIDNATTLGGWRIAFVEDLLPTYERKKQTIPDIVKVRTKFIEDIYREIFTGNGAAIAASGALEVSGLASKMGFKHPGDGAIMRHSMATAKGREIYPEEVRKVIEKNPQAWLDSADMQGSKSLTIMSSKELYRRMTPQQRIQFVKQHALHIKDLNDELSSRNTKVYTAPDMGTSPYEMLIILASGITDKVACFPEIYGGSGDPSPVTAHAVANAAEGSLKALGKDGNKMTIAIPGAAGHVGQPLFRYYSEYYPGSRLIVADVNDPEKIAIMKNMIAQHPNAAIIDKDAIFDKNQLWDKDHKEVLYSPCARPEVLTEDSLEKAIEANVTVVCGAANSQFEVGKEEPLAQEWFDSEILVVPEMLANVGGVRSLRPQFFTGERPEQRIVNASIIDVLPMSEDVTRESLRKNITPQEEFNNRTLKEMARSGLRREVLYPAKTSARRS